MTDQERVMFSISTPASLVKKVELEDSPVVAGMASDKATNMKVISIPTSMGIEEDRLEGILREIRQMWKNRQTAYAALQFEGIENTIFLLPIEGMEYVGGKQNLMYLYLGYEEKDDGDLGVEDNFNAEY